MRSFRFGRGPPPPVLESGQKKRTQIMTTDGMPVLWNHLGWCGTYLDIRQVKRTQLNSRYVFSGDFGTANN
jgi:hypothetical protein